MNRAWAGQCCLWQALIWEYFRPGSLEFSSENESNQHQCCLLMTRHRCWQAATVCEARLYCRRRAQASPYTQKFWGQNLGWLLLGGVKPKVSATGFFLGIYFWSVDSCLPSSQLNTKGRRMRSNTVATSRRRVHERNIEPPHIENKSTICLSI